MDNIDNNNTYINNLFIKFRFDLLYYYIYYMGYIINLITYILLFGVDLSTLNKKEENKDKVIHQILT